MKASTLYCRIEDGSSLAVRISVHWPRTRFRVLRSPRQPVDGDSSIVLLDPTSRGRRRNLGGRVEAAGLEHIKGALRDRALFLTHRPEEFWQQRRRHWGPCAREDAPAAAQPASSCESNVASVGVQTSVPDAASAGAPPDAPPSKKTRPNKKARALHRAHLEAQGSWVERSPATKVARSHGAALEFLNGVFQCSARCREHCRLVLRVPLRIG